jgi:hypothetical protein
MIMYNNKNHLIYVLLSSSGILNNWKTQHVGNWMFPFSGEGREILTLLGPLERAKLTH